MKTNCRALKISILISILSVTLATMFFAWYYCTNNCIIEYIKDIFLGIFCSSVVTVFFYSSSYITEKRLLLEKFWMEVRKALIEQYKIEYLYSEFEEKLLVDYIHERRSYKTNKDFEKNFQSYSFKTKQDSINKLKDIIKDENKNIIDEMSPRDKKFFIQRNLDRIYEKLTNNIDKITSQYIDYMNYSVENLNLILGDVEFFWQKDLNYQKVYDIYRKLFDLRQKIQENNYHFLLYKKGEGNKAIVLSKIFELQKNIFKIEENDEFKLIYNEFNDEMNDALETFRAKIIYKTKPEYLERAPILEIMKLKNKNEEDKK